MSNYKCRGECYERVPHFSMDFKKFLTLLPVVCLEHVRPFFASTESQEFIFAIARGEGGDRKKYVFEKKKSNFASCGPSGACETIFCMYKISGIYF